MFHFVLYSFSVVAISATPINSFPNKHRFPRAQPAEVQNVFEGVQLEPIERLDDHPFPKVFSYRIELLEDEVTTTEAAVVDNLLFSPTSGIDYDDLFDEKQSDDEVEVTEDYQSDSSRSIGNEYADGIPDSFHQSSLRDESIPDRQTGSDEGSTGLVTGFETANSRYEQEILPRNQRTTDQQNQNLFGEASNDGYSVDFIDTSSSTCTKTSRYVVSSFGTIICENPKTNDSLSDGVDETLPTNVNIIQRSDYGNQDEANYNDALGSQHDTTESENNSEFVDFHSTDLSKGHTDQQFGDNDETQHETNDLTTNNPSYFYTEPQNPYKFETDDQGYPLRYNYDIDIRSGPLNRFDVMTWPELVTTNANNDYDVDVGSNSNDSIVLLPPNNIIQPSNVGNSEFSDETSQGDDVNTASVYYYPVTNIQALKYYNQNRADPTQKFTQVEQLSGNNNASSTEKTSDENVPNYVDVDNQNANTQNDQYPGQLVIAANPFSNVDVQNNKEVNPTRTDESQSSTHSSLSVSTNDGYRAPQYFSGHNGAFLVERVDRNESNSDVDYSRDESSNTFEIGGQNDAVTEAEKTQGNDDLTDERYIIYQNDNDPQGYYPKNQATNPTQSSDNSFESLNSDTENSDYTNSDNIDCEESSNCYGDSDSNPPSITSRPDGNQIDSQNVDGDSIGEFSSNTYIVDEEGVKVPIKLLAEDHYADGSFKFEYESADGSMRKEVGRVLPEGGIALSGRYQFHSPDGRTHHVQYTADQRGYRPRIRVLPAPEEKPSLSLESQEEPVPTPLPIIPSL